MKLSGILTFTSEKADVIRQGHYCHCSIRKDPPWPKEPPSSAQSDRKSVV